MKKRIASGYSQTEKSVKELDLLLNTKGISFERYLEAISVHRRLLPQYHHQDHLPPPTNTTIILIFSEFFLRRYSPIVHSLFLFSLIVYILELIRCEFQMSGSPIRPVRIQTVRIIRCAELPERRSMPVLINPFQ